MFSLVLFEVMKIVKYVEKHLDIFWGVNLLGMSCCCIFLQRDIGKCLRDDDPQKFM